MTEKKDLSNLLDKEIEKAEEIRQYYRELLARYEVKIDALKDLRIDCLDIEKEDLSNLLDKEIEKAEEMHQYYKELLARYEGKIEALKDIRYDLNQEEEEEKKGE